MLDRLFSSAAAADRRRPSGKVLRAMLAAPNQKERIAMPHIVELVPGENFIPGLFVQPSIVHRPAEGGAIEFRVSVKRQEPLSAPADAGRRGNAVSVAFCLDKTAAITLRQQLDEEIKRAGL
jgi:hypothetical protein